MPSPHCISTQASCSHHSAGTYTQGLRGPLSLPLVLGPAHQVSGRVAHPLTSASPLSWPGPCSALGVPSPTPQRPPPLLCPLSCVVNFPSWLPPSLTGHILNERSKKAEQSCLQVTSPHSSRFEGSSCANIHSLQTSFTLFSHALGCTEVSPGRSSNSSPSTPVPCFPSLCSGWLVSDTRCSLPAGPLAVSCHMPCFCEGPSSQPPP